MTGTIKVEARSTTGHLGPEQIRAVIRQRIFSGELAAGTSLSQVQLAEELQVSRTPVREALRMLEAEGLVESERNRRMVVAALSVEDLEYAYAGRIVLEAFAARLTAPVLAPADLRSLQVDLERMEDCAERDDFDNWEIHHEHFHDGLVRSAGSQIVRQIDQMQAQGRRYRSLYMTTQPSEAWTRSAVDHYEVLKAFREGNPETASHRLARHLAQTALTLVAATDPSHDPVGIRTALKTVTSGS